MPSWRAPAPARWLADQDLPAADLIGTTIAEFDSTDVPHFSAPGVAGHAGKIRSVDADGTLNDSDQVRRIGVVNQPNGDWTLLIDGNMLAKGTSSIDEATDPKTVDLTVTESSDGNNIGHIFKGIYELGEKTRRVCLARDGGERPTEFFSAAASGHMLVTYEKVEEE